MIMIAKKRAFVKNEYAFSAFFGKDAVKSVLFPDKLPVFLAAFILRFRQNPAQW